MSPRPILDQRLARGRRAATWGILTNAALAAIKLVAGVAGSSYALVADAVESLADVFSSLVVWGGLRISAREADEQFPFGYGKAETLAGAVVGLALLAAAAGIGVEAWREIRTPHAAPEPFTLAVLVGVVLVKEGLFRTVFRIGDETGSSAVRADAWHHRSDALTSAAAALGIGAGLLGGPGWESADDWAALVATTVIVWNGIAILRPAIADLMDRTPERAVVGAIAAAASAVEGVEAIETLRVRRSGLGLFVDIHVEADPEMSLHQAHVLSGKVKTAILAAVATVVGVLVHMEPHAPERPAADDGGGVA